MPRKIETIGKVFHRLTVIAEMPKTAGRRRVICNCECGKQINLDPRSLFGGHSKSCGCLQKETLRDICAQRRTHGQSRSKEYNTWIHIKKRCTNRNSSKYPIYGGRGIKICDRWLDSFENFFKDMGKAPSSAHSIDRIDSNGNYEPSNCRWATIREQNLNKRNHRIVIYQKESMPLSEACRLAGVNYGSALYRINAGKHWQSLPQPPEEEND